MPVGHAAGADAGGLFDLRSRQLNRPSLRHLSPVCKKSNLIVALCRCGRERSHVFVLRRQPVRRSISGVVIVPDAASLPDPVASEAATSTRSPRLHEHMA